MGRLKKTVEELDAEMNDYFAESADAAAAPAAAPPAQAAAVDEDEDMIL
jgi:THO complex subunit 4